MNCGFELPSQTSAIDRVAGPGEGARIIGLVDIEKRPMGGHQLVNEAVEKASSPSPEDAGAGPPPLLLPAPSRAASSTSPDREQPTPLTRRGRGRKGLLLLFILTAAVTVAAGAVAYFSSQSDGSTIRRASDPAASSGESRTMKAPESSAAPPVTHRDLRLPGRKQFIDLWNPPSREIPVRGSANRATELPPTASEAAYVGWMSARTNESETFLRQRWNRAQVLQRNKLFAGRSVFDAFLLTPREWFCRSFNLSEAYASIPLPIGYGQIMPSPGLSVRMIDLLDPRSDDRVLEIGTGSGYQSALLAQIVSSVYTVEIVKPLAEETNRLFELHSDELPRLAEIHRRIGDGYYGWKKEAPFDRIIVTVSIDHIPPELIDQLKPGGIMVVPVGPPAGQHLLMVTKKVSPDGRVKLERAQAPGAAVRLLPMTSASGRTHNLK